MPPSPAAPAHLDVVAAMARGRGDRDHRGCGGYFLAVGAGTGERRRRAIVHSSAIRRDGLPGLGGRGCVARRQDGRVRRRFRCPIGKRAVGPVARFDVGAPAGRHSRCGVAVLVTGRQSHRILHECQAEGRHAVRRARRDLGRRAEWPRSVMEPRQRDSLRAGCRRTAVPDLGQRRNARAGHDARSGAEGIRSPLRRRSCPMASVFCTRLCRGKTASSISLPASLSNKSRTFVGSFEAAPVFAEPGWLLYARQGVLAALPFDADALKVTGDPVVLEDEPSSILDPAISWTAGWSVSVSASGSLGYYSAPSTNTIATWYDANGVPSGTLNLPPGPLRIDHDLARWNPRCRGAIDVAVRIDAVARRSGARGRDTALLGTRAQRYAGVVTRRHSRGLGCRSRRRRRTCSSRAWTTPRPSNCSFNPTCRSRIPSTGRATGNGS